MIFKVILNVDTDGLELDPTKEAVETFVLEDMLLSASLDSDQVSLDCVLEPGVGV